MSKRKETFLSDLQGKLRNTNLPISHLLYPVFEAITNSIEAIEERGNENGKITIEIIRNKKQQLAINGDNPLQPITGFKIIDNGIGFNDINYQSFLTTDSSHKVKKGSRGNGRFTWLKAFKNVKVTSLFLSNDSSWNFREFEFDPINGLALIEDTVKNEGYNDCLTEVNLIDLQSPYYSKCPQKIDTLAHRIIEHFLVYLLLDCLPTIEINDQYNNKSLTINSYYSENLKLFSDEQTFVIKGNTFFLRGIRFYRSQNTNHILTLCANKRVVEKIKLANYVSNIHDQQKIRDLDDSLFTYVACVYSDFLDKSVSSDRMSFNLTSESELDFDVNDDSEMESEFITKKEIISSSIIEINKQLESYLKVIEESKQEEIRKFIIQDAPEYRPLLKYARERLQNIKPGLSREKLDLALHKELFQIESELKEKKQEILSSPPQHFYKYPEYRNQYISFLEQYNSIGMSRLASYVTHRKIIIDLFERNLYSDSDGKYQIEKNIHELIFPLRQTSNDFNVFEKQNLWMIDERLSYHEYLASDQPLASLENIETDSFDRPDLVVFNEAIFNKAIAFADGENQPYSSIVIIEFKRPGRDGYRDQENPISQVTNYIDKINSGRHHDRRGRVINLPKDTPFYAYIICDIPPKIANFAKLSGLTITHDSQGWFGYLKDWHVYIEIISFDKLVRDAKQRNKVLFRNLGLD